MPNSILAMYTKRYPDAWRMADAFRQDRGKNGLPDWPGWCYLPLGGWYAIVSARAGKTRLGPTDIAVLADMAPLAALGAWRYTQGIYRFHPFTLAALADTVPSGDLPVEVLLRLPEWCVYVETGGFSELDGFFAFLESDANNARMELRIIGHASGVLRGMIPIHLGPWTITEAMDRARQTAKKIIPGFADLMGDDQLLIDEAQSMYPLVSLLLYLCADEPDITGHLPGVYPQHPRPKKIKSGWRMFPPDKPRIWHVGGEIGERLRQAMETTKHHAPETGQAIRRAHIRRAHWHGYWTGPIKPRSDVPEEQQRRRFGYRWLHPVLVGGNDE